MDLYLPMHDCYVYKRCTCYDFCTLCSGNKIVLTEALPEITKTIENWIYSCLEHDSSAKQAIVNVIRQNLRDLITDPNLKEIFKSLITEILIDSQNFVDITREVAKNQ